jgi:hypothetical protein
LKSGKVNLVKNTFTLTGVMLGVWAFLTGLSTGFLGEISPESQAPSTLILFFAIVLANVLVLEWYIIRSTVKGRRLFFILFLEIFGVIFFMPQIETLVFNESIGMPIALVISLIISGAIVAGVVSRLAVRLFKKQDSDAIIEYNTSLWDGPLSDLAGKFAVLAFIYLALYMLFGYYVAWQFVGLREYYSGSTVLLGFVDQWLNTLKTNPIALPLQLFRGLLWAGLAFLATRTMDTEKSWEKPVIVGLLMSIGLSLQILLPQAYMPAAVRYGHFPEILLENFIFGVIASKLLD